MPNSHCFLVLCQLQDVQTAMGEIVPLLLRFCESWASGLIETDESIVSNPLRQYKHAQPVCFDLMRPKSASPFDFLGYKLLCLRRSAVVNLKAQPRVKS